MPIERTAKCPQCGRPVRLTEDELVAKRGFCAVCDARFDVLPDLLVGDGPMRSLMVPQVAALSKPPTSKLQEVEGRFMVGRIGAARVFPFAMLGTFGSMAVL